MFYYPPFHMLIKAEGGGSQDCSAGSKTRRCEAKWNASFLDRETSCEPVNEDTSAKVSSQEQDWILSEAFLQNKIPFFNNFKRSRPTRVWTVDPDRGPLQRTPSEWGNSGVLNQRYWLQNEETTQKIQEVKHIFNFQRNKRMQIFF